MNDLQRLALKFLDYAYEDLESARILLSHNIRRNALLLTQQALEKALKAYYLGVFINLFDLLKTLERNYEKKLIPRFRKEMEFNKSIRQLSKPKSIGHELRPMIKRLDELLKAFGGVHESELNLQGYIATLIRYLSKKLRSKRCLHLLIKKGISESDARRVIDAACMFINEAADLMVKFRIKPYEGATLHEVLSQIKGMGTKEGKLVPCIKFTSMLYYNQINALNKLYSEVLSKNVDMDKLLNIVNKVHNIPKETIVSLSMKVIKSVIECNAVLALFTCLYRYFEPCRYPDKPPPLEEDLNSLEEALKITEHIIHSLKELFEVINLEIEQELKL